jgi:hypothetical protein
MQSHVLNLKSPRNAITIKNFIPKKKTGFDRMEQVLRMLNR